VQLSFGVGYLKSSSIIGAEELTINALEAIGVTTDTSGNEFVNNVNVTESFKSRVHDTPQHILSEPSKVFFGTQICYVFFRLHHILVIHNMKYIII
jgi:hypothetical protein